MRSGDSTIYERLEGLLAIRSLILCRTLGHGTNTKPSTEEVS